MSGLRCACGNPLLDARDLSCGQCRPGRPEKPTDAIRGVSPAALRALVAEMRAGGVGVLSLGDVTIDLTRAPARMLPAEPPKPSRPTEGDDEEDGEGESEGDPERDRVLFGAGAGRRVRLPFGGRS